MVIPAGFGGFWRESAGDAAAREVLGQKYGVEFVSDLEIAQ
jgi:hypothetical protein